MEYFVLPSNSNYFVWCHLRSFLDESSQSCKFATWRWRQHWFKSVTQNSSLVCTKPRDHSVIHISKERHIGDDSTIVWEVFTLNLFTLGATSVLHRAFLMPQGQKWNFNIKIQYYHIVWQLNSILRKHKGRKEIHRL